jgi:hypothetical protein
MFKVIKLNRFNGSELWRKSIVASNGTAERWKNHCVAAVFKIEARD